ncbi:hypothetical protein COOONC_03205 [Cooperia oncophora]
MPSCTIPSADVSKYKVFVDDYRTELLRGLQLIRDEVRANSEKYRAKMKEVYDRRKDVDVLSLPSVGGRVFMRLPREKVAIEDAIKVQYDLLLKCPEEIPNERVNTKTRRKRVKRVLKISVFKPQIEYFRPELEFDVPGRQPRPARSIQMPWPGLSVNQRRAEFRVVRLLCVEDDDGWRSDFSVATSREGSAGRMRFGGCKSPGSAALKAQRIMDLDDKAVDPRSLGFAYAVFRSKCAHVSLMARAIEPATIMRHGSLSRGWPELPKRFFELGWLTARKVDPKEFDLSSMMARVHDRILLVVPVVLRRMAWMSAEEEGARRAGSFEGGSLWFGEPET